MLANKCSEAPLPWTIIRFTDVAYVLLWINEYIHQRIHVALCKKHYKWLGLFSFKGQALIFAPSRGDTFDKFASLVSSSKDFTVLRNTTQYDDHVWNLHLKVTHFIHFNHLLLLPTQNSQCLKQQLCCTDHGIKWLTAYPIENDSWHIQFSTEKQ